MFLGHGWYFGKVLDDYVGRLGGMTWIGLNGLFVSEAGNATVAIMIERYHGTPIR